MIAPGASARSASSGASDAVLPSNPAATTPRASAVSA
jgi:hypothetical protein